MGIPQIIIVCLYVLSLGINLAKHGEERVEKYNFFWSLIACVVVMAVLYWGGFFS